MSLPLEILGVANDQVLKTRIRLHQRSRAISASQSALVTNFG